MLLWKLLQQQLKVQKRNRLCVHRLDPSPIVNKRISTTSFQKDCASKAEDLTKELQNLVKVHPELQQFDVHLQALVVAVGELAAENQAQSELITRLSDELSNVKAFLQKHAIKIDLLLGKDNRFSADERASFQLLQGMMMTLLDELDANESSDIPEEREANLVPLADKDVPNERFLNQTIQPELDETEPKRYFSIFNQRATPAALQQTLHHQQLQRIVLQRIVLQTVHLLILRMKNLLLKDFLKKKFMEEWSKTHSKDQFTFVTQVEPLKQEI